MSNTLILLYRCTMLCKEGMKRGLRHILLPTMLSGCTFLSEPSLQGSLYVRLGGELGVQKLVDNFTLLNVSDPRMNSSLMGLAADVRRHTKYKNRLARFICHKAEGGCGDTTSEVEMEFKRIPLTPSLAELYVENFSRVLDQTDVSLDDRVTLLGYFRSVVLPLTDVTDRATNE